MKKDEGSGAPRRIDCTIGRSRSRKGKTMRMKIMSLVIAVAGCALLSAGAARADAVIGQEAPAFVVPTLAGKTFDLKALKGKVVVVNFWATWCAQCSGEMPALEAVWRQYHSKGLEVLAVSADRPRARGAVDQVMHFFSFPAAMLNAVTKNDLVTVTSVPVTYVIGKDGNVENILTPPLLPLTEAGLGDEVKTLLDAKTEAKPEAKEEAKPDIKSDAKAETKPDAKAETKPDAKP